MQKHTHTDSDEYCIVAVLQKPNLLAYWSHTARPKLRVILITIFFLNLLTMCVKSKLPLLDLWKR